MKHTGQDGKKDDLTDVPDGVIISSSDDMESEGEASAAATAPSAPTNNDRAFLLSSSAFAPPLPASESLSPQLRRGLMATMASRASGGPLHRSSSGSSAGAGQGAGSAPIVHFTSLGSREDADSANVNSRMDASLEERAVEAMGVLDASQAANTFEQFGLGDSGFLEGIPGGMFDWGGYCPYDAPPCRLTLIFFPGQWEAYFSRLSNSSSDGLAFQRLTQNPASPTNLQQQQQPENAQNNGHHYR